MLGMLTVRSAVAVRGGMRSRRRTASPVCGDIAQVPHKRQNAATPSHSSGSSVKKEDVSLWLFKSEPEDYSLQDLEKEGVGCWDGVRNAEARNFMRDRMKVGHQGFFYHSNCPDPAIVGIVEVVRAGYPDHTAFDRKDKHFDAKSDPSNPKWYMVDVQFIRALKRPITLQELRLHSGSSNKGKRVLSDALQEMALFKRSRLSVQPVRQEEWDFVLSLEEQEPTT